MTPSNTEESLVERVAKELHALSCARRRFPVPWEGRWTSRTYYRGMARRAIAAATEPTERMRRAGDAKRYSGASNYDASDVWQAMIQAALSEGEG